MNIDYLRDGTTIPRYKASRSPKRKMFYTGYRSQMSIDTGYFYCPYIPGQPDEYVWDHRAVNYRITAMQRAITEVIYFHPMLSHSIKPDMIHASYNKG